jgi:hypothetical protein
MIFSISELAVASLKMTAFSKISGARYCSILSVRQGRLPSYAPAAAQEWSRPFPAAGVARVDHCMVIPDLSSYKDTLFAIIMKKESLYFFMINRSCKKT